MPSRLDALAARDFATGMPEIKQTIIRRIGGNSATTESVQADVQLDDVELGGLTDDNKGQYTEQRGRLELDAAQEHTPHDTWVIDGEVFKTVGNVVSKDPATKTISIVQRKGMRGREPRVTGR